MKQSIKTSRLFLRPLTKNDARFFFDYLLDIDEHLSLIAPKSLKEAEQLVEKYIEKENQGKASYFIIEDLQVGEFIGLVGVGGLGTDNINRTCWIRKSGQRNGYAFEAISAFMEYVNQYLDYDVMYSAFDVTNIATKKLNEKLGGIPGSLVSRPTLQESGKILNIIWYEYWNPHKQKFS